MKFCPQCGTQFEPEARFCHECGFDKTKVLIVGNEEPSSPQPSEETLSGNINIQPPVASIPETTPVAETVISQTPSETSVSSEPVNVPVFRTVDSVEKRIEKKKLMQIAFLIIGIACIAVLIWLGYSNFSTRQTVLRTDSIATMAAREIPSIDTTDIATEVLTEESETEIPDQSQDKAKQQNKVDQELTKQKVTKQNNPQLKATQPVQVDKTIPKTPEKDIASTVIFEVGRAEESKYKNPKTPTKFTIRNPIMIVRITTDHYNDGMGTPRGGTISIKDKSGYVLGIFKAIGRAGKNGTPSAKWVVEPNVVLDKGTYYLWDSDMTTWSKNLLGNGFVVIEGYEVNETE